MHPFAERGLRALFLAIGACAAVLAAGCVGQQPWALSNGPWAGGRLANVFAGSILAAVALPMLWIGASGRLAAAAGGFLHLGVMLGGAASVLASLAQQAPQLAVPAAGSAVAAAGCLVCAAWFHRRPMRDTRALPLGLRVWFCLYVLILVPAGVLLLRHVPGVMPWPLKPESSSLYGWVFLSAVCSFVYPLLRRRIEAAYVGLLGFLAYDLVLLPPFAAHLAAVPPAFRTTLTVYTSVLVLTALVSLWYLFGCRQTRLAGLPLVPRAHGNRQAA